MIMCNLKIWTTYYSCFLFSEKISVKSLWVDIYSEGFLLLKML